MTRLRLTPVLEDAALGTFVNSRVTGSLKYFNHNGGNEGFSCTAIGCLDKGEGVVIMTNSDNSSILEEIANSVATVYKWKDYYLPEIKKVIDVDGPVLDKYVGKYNLNGTTVTFKKRDNGLLVNVFGDFFIREYRGYLKFQTDKDNKVTGFFFNGMPVKKID